jgi:hypothetical protein
MRVIISKFASYQNDIDVLLANMHDIMFDICFEQHFAKYVRDQFRESFNNENVSLINEVRKSILVIVQSADIMQLIDKTGIPRETAITSLPNTLFMFGEGLYVNVSNFNVEQFKTKIASSIVSSFYPYFYIQRLNASRAACTDANQSCTRIYKLASYIYVYYMVMTIFLIVFSTDDSVEKYKKTTNENDINVDDKRASMVFIMDTTLLKLNSPTMSEKGEQKDIAVFYDNIRRMSLENVQASNKVVESKRDIDNLQNNLKNYNAMENITYNDLLNTRISFYVQCILWIAVVIYMFAATFSRHLFAADLVTFISVVTLLWLMIDPRKHYRIQRVRS